MEIRSVTVTAAGVFDNPHGRFSNVRPGVTLTADVAPGDDFDEEVRILQGVTNTLMLGHKDQILRRLKEEQDRRDREADEARRRRLEAAASLAAPDDEDDEDEDDEEFDDEDEDEDDLDPMDDEDDDDDED